MRPVYVAFVALTACSFLTEIPDDATSGERSAQDAGDAGIGTVIGDPIEAGEPKPADTDASVVLEAGPPDAEAGAPSVVAVDAIGPTASGTGGANVASPFGWSHTTSGTNRALFVVVTIGDGADGNISIDGVTYDGAALTRLGIQHANDKTAGYTTLWAMANPAAGAHPVSVSFTGSPDVLTAGSISFTGVDQTAPYRNVTKVGGAGASPKLDVASAPGNMVVAALVAACTVNASGQPKGWVKNVTCANGGGNGAQSAAAGAPTVKLSYDMDADWWGLIAADVRAAR